MINHEINYIFRINEVVLLSIDNYNSSIFNVISLSAVYINN